MTAKIHDLGYRAYEGPRAGIGWSVRSLAVHTIRRALGLKRNLRHKLAPSLSIIVAFGPAIALTGLAAFFRGEIIPELIGYGDYIGITTFSMFILAAAVVPGVLTTDRTNGMLALYLASPLDRTTYVLGRALGLFVVMTAVAVGPIMFLVLGYTFAGAGPDGFFGFIELLFRAFVAGLLASVFYIGLAMFLSSIPRRWAMASVAVVAVLLVSGGIVGALSTAVDDAPAALGLVAPGSIIDLAASHIMGDPIEGEARLLYDRWSGGQLIAAAVAWAAVCMAGTWWRWQRIKVER